MDLPGERGSGTNWANLDERQPATFHGEPSVLKDQQEKDQQAYIPVFVAYNSVPRKIVWLIYKDKA